LKKSHYFGLIVVVFIVVMSVSVFAEVPAEELISVDFFNTDVRTAFQDLSYQAGITILVDDYVQGYVSLYLTDVPVERVIEVICLKGGYGYKKIENALYLIGSIEPSNPTFQKHAETEIIRLDYADASTVLGLLAHYQKYLRATDGVIVVRAWPNQIESILQEIKALDRPVKQVLGQVIIAEVTAEAKRELGLGNVKDGLTVIDGLTSGQTTLSLADSVKLASILKILQAEGKASLKASPTIVVPEGSSATISIGKEVRQVVYKTLQNAYSIEKMEAATQLTLEVQRITANDEIWMSYEVSAGDISGDFQENTPTILTRMAKGTVIVANNTVFTIGGLTKQVDNAIDSTFPPGKQGFQQDTELLIIIFPHIIGSEMPEEKLQTYSMFFVICNNIFTCATRGFPDHFVVMFS
jgi:type II secretory pathway component HofQ